MAGASVFRRLHLLELFHCLEVASHCLFRGLCIPLQGFEVAAIIGNLHCFGA